MANRAVAREPLASASRAGDCLCSGSSTRSAISPTWWRHRGVAGARANPRSLREGIDFSTATRRLASRDLLGHGRVRARSHQGEGAAPVRRQRSADPASSPTSRSRRPVPCTRPARITRTSPPRSGAPAPPSTARSGRRNGDGVGGQGTNCPRRAVGLLRQRRGIGLVPGSPPRRLWLLRLRRTVASPADRSAIRPRIMAAELHRRRRGATPVAAGLAPFALSI